MSDDTETQEVAAEPEVSIGAVLREAREARELTEEAAASSLHLDPAILRALERDDFARLGAPVFVRGHLRKYAGLLGLDGDALLTRYQAVESASDPLPSPPTKRPDRFAVDDGLNWPVVLAVLVVLLIAAVAVWRLWAQPAEPVPVETDLSLALEAGVQPLLSEIEPTLLPTLRSRAPADPAATDPSPPDSSPPGPSMPAAETTPAPAPAAAELAPGEGLHLVIGFTGECWTEISDADGRRLFFGLAAADQRVDVRGRPPVSVLLGNAAAATLWIDGEPWRVPPEQIVNNVARLRLDPPR